MRDISKRITRLERTGQLDHVGHGGHAEPDEHSEHGEDGEHGEHADGHDQRQRRIDAGAGATGRGTPPTGPTGPTEISGPAAATVAHRASPRRTRRAVAVVLAVAAVPGLFGTACSTGTTTTTASAGAAGGPGATGPANASSAATSTAGDNSVVTLPGGQPVDGGALVFGLEAETLGWNPTVNTWAQSGHEVGNAIFDPLAAYDAKGVAQPYLAKAFEHDAAFTTWTIRLREGVTFHDGTPCDATAIVRSFEAYRKAVLTASVFSTITDVTKTDDLSVKITLSRPWASFPTILATQAGYVAAPAQLDDQTEAGIRHPIGTGPFVFDHWNASELVVTKNKAYWRKGLPHLDKITFKPLLDSTTRAAALSAGDVDMIHTSDATTIVGLRANAAEGKLQVVNDTGEQEEYSLMLNNAAPPFDDVRARRAVALATDRARYLELTGAGITEDADGPFVKTSPWYVEHGYPDFDPEAAKKLVAEYSAEKGELHFTLGSFADAQSQQTAQALQQIYGEVGIKVDIDSIEQQALGVKAITGQYQALSWRQFSAPDPDGDYVWWHTGPTAAGTVSLNFARITNPEIDKALEDGRSTDDPAVRKAAYQRLQEQFGTTVPFIWLAHTTWTVAADNRVRNIANGPLPDGSPSMPFGGQMSGYGRLTETWLTPK